MMMHDDDGLSTFTCSECHGETSVSDQCQVDGRYICEDCAGADDIVIKFEILTKPTLRRRTWDEVAKLIARWPTEHIFVRVVDGNPFIVATDWP
jgi:hypothetical protein